MTRTLLTAGAVALGIGLSSGLAWADINSGQAAQPPGKPAAYPGYAPPWHYEWRYSYGHHNEWKQQWIPVLNEPK
jgi:hypothetical protein